VSRRGTSLWILALLATWLLVPPAAAEAPLWASDRGEVASEEQQLALGADVADAVGAPAGDPVDGEVLVTLTEHLAAQIRCPVCQGQSVQASTSEAARNMKQQIQAMVAAGYSDDQVLRYFESSYGQFIRMMPRAEGFNLLVWVIPALALLLGVLVSWRAIVNLGARPARDSAVAEASSEPSEKPTTEAEAAELEPWLQKVREEMEAGNG